MAGGQGTRLRPLTLTVAKPVMPLAGRPFLTFMLDWLARHGVEDVVLSCGFLADGVERVLGDSYGGLTLRYVNEEEPLGTAGPVRLAADAGVLEERLLVLNGDVLTDIDLTAQLRMHAERGALATLALVAVEDTASYGVVPTAADGSVEAFLEKSSGAAPTKRINAGAYVLQREVVDRIPSGRPVSFEREVFPGLVDEPGPRTLFGYPADGYWIDIGTPDRYLEGTYDLLAGRVESSLPPRNATSSLAWEGAMVDPSATVGPLSVLGRGCTVAAGSAVRRSVLHDRVSIGCDCVVEGSVVAEGASVESGARVAAGSVIGSGAVIAAGTSLAPGTRIDPGTRVEAAGRVDSAAGAGSAEPVR